jgi:23S rRNA G2445 N2-methylase RlmL
MTKAVRLMARTLRGLEDVAAEEIERTGVGSVDSTRHREVWFTAASDPTRVTGLRTVDDVFVLGSVVEGIGHTKDDLRSFVELVEQASPRELVRTRAACGGGPGGTGVDVAASFLGRRNYSRYDIEDAVGERLAEALRLPYHSRKGNQAPPPGTLSFRVTLEDGRALLGLRVLDAPMHRRSYKNASTPGTTHPPLAAAIARLADIEPGHRVYDPCCGVGTIPIEAGFVAPDAHYLGTDRDVRLPAEARANAAAAHPAGTAIGWSVADAGRMPVGRGRVDRILGNPPWDRQVTARGVLAGRPARFYDEVHRVLSPSGRAVLLLHEADDHLALAEKAGLRPRGIVPVSLFGTRPSIVTFTTA